MKLIVQIPAYNEEATIAQVIRDVPPNGTLIDVHQIPGSGLNGCGAAAVVPWPNLGAGIHLMPIQIDPAATLPEMGRTNNQAVGQFLVSTYQTYLPTIRKN